MALQLVAAAICTPDGKRKRLPSKKLSAADFVIDKPSGYCPGCNEYVNYSDKGVVCSSCVAYWHYRCANVTEEEVNNLGEDDFFCFNHKQSKKTQAGNSKFGVSKSKTDPYTLNMKTFYKKLMKNLSNVFESERKDDGKQYVVSLNTVTYLIMLSNIIDMGERSGLNIKRNTDLSEKETKAQFDVNISKGNLQVPISMTCFHTTTSILIQAKGKRKERGWTEKLGVLEVFVKHTVRNNKSSGKVFVLQPSKRKCIQGNQSSYDG